MIKEYDQISLLEFNTFGIDVKCRRLVEFTSHDDLVELASGGCFDGRWDVVGGGSNIIFTHDYPGTMLHAAGGSISVVEQRGDRVRVRAEAGVVWDDFVKWCMAEGLWGAENLSGIPGAVGAAPVQNIGAYGVEAKDIIASVETFVVDNSSRLDIARAHCDFGYRSSIFKHYLKGKTIVTAVNFDLSRKPSPSTAYGDLAAKTEELGGPTLENIRAAVKSIRDSKLPDPRVTGNAGSFFKNPVVEEGVATALKEKYPDMPLYPAQEAGHAKLAAGWLIDRCGWKGRREGNVGVHERQALVLVNLGGATGDEVMALAGRITGDVERTFGVRLETEVVVI